MRRAVRDIVEIRECESLDGLLDRLRLVRDALPDPAAARVRLRGDDVFGRLISISYTRPLTEDEAALEARYRVQG
ncbi:MAG TPA: hypothetical protein VGD66_05805 [Allosphingosinicella sp.]|jgi:hypothetical protein